ncbi:hypothetical protein QAD02_002797 [Eretmocerus hayati]|uniref:Uncharacterized protein n=1 Tax=Eretmocerus hayati TaxID=131215 RepID=A0ACC2NL65_9HYME|nr:hypothetical protein QAD02_002797 [Eretmocerus hayati]
MFESILCNSKGPGMFKLDRLASDFLEVEVDNQRLHTVIYDVIILRKVVKALGLEENLVDIAKPIAKYFLQHDKNEIIGVNPPYSHELKEIVHRDTLRKIASKSITFQSSLDIYRTDGVEGLEAFMTRAGEDGRPRISKDREFLSKIISCIENHAKIA